MKVDPTPTSDSSVTFPHICSASCRTSASPRQEIFQLLEFLENCFTVFQGDARAGIANGKGNRIVRPAYVEADAAGGGELDGVTQQIVQNLPQARGVSGDLGRQVGGEIKLERQALRFGAGPESRCALANQLGERSAES